ncbi:hypothetical protein MKX03_021145 [Papaver bracteatum]|nr:hypothetical protein MKX03_021145 [Papaver bracteatum]
MSTEELLRPAADTSSAETVGVSNIIDVSDDLEAAVQSQSSFISFAASLGMRKLLFLTVFVSAIVIHTSKKTVDDISVHGTSKTTKYTQYSSASTQMMLTLLASATCTAGAVLVIAILFSKLLKISNNMWASFGLLIFTCSLFVWIIVYSAGAIRAP